MMWRMWRLDLRELGKVSEFLDYGDCELPTLAVAWMVNTRDFKVRKSSGSPLVFYLYSRKSS